MATRRSEKEENRHDGVPRRGVFEMFFAVRATRFACRNARSSLPARGLFHIIETVGYSQRRYALNARGKGQAVIDREDILVVFSRSCDSESLVNNAWREIETVLVKDKYRFALD